jgi:CheY-like chemotaxis protein
MGRKRILFVDDDPDILAAFYRLFWRERSRWEVVFANGPTAALTELAKGRFDVVVSDLLMPGMRGDELLRLVHESSATTIRILLSGSADAEQLRPLVDCVLAKPCDLKVLRATIEDAPYQEVQCDTAAG